MVAHRSHARRAVALLGGLALFAGFGLATLQPAQADDDDWHTEADRPLTPHATPDPQSGMDVGMDQDGPFAREAAKPAHETLYAPDAFAAIRWSQPVVSDTELQTGAVDARR